MPTQEYEKKWIFSSFGVVNELNLIDGIFNIFAYFDGTYRQSNV